MNSLRLAAAVSALSPPSLAVPSATRATAAMVVVR
jgi:hypothetical protein